MKKSILIAAVVLAGVAGVAALSLMGNNEEPAASSPQPISSSETLTSNQPLSNADDQKTVDVASTGEYTDFSQEALANSDSKNNIIFFHANWCSVCNAVERNIQAGSIPNDMTIFKVDYESEVGRELANTYNIPIQYTMVQVNTDGSEITQWVNNYDTGVTEIVNQLQES